MTRIVRPTAVAGTFYPGTAVALQHCIAELLAESMRQSQGTKLLQSLPPKAVIVPHAGYIYSGPIAARLYHQLSRWKSLYRHIILLGPTHRVAVHGLAVPACDAFATPLGEVRVDTEARATLSELTQVGISDVVHAQEHALEVQLPFLQVVLDDFTVLPLAVGDAEPESVAEVLDHLWGGPETLIMVSSDLSHYLPYEAARQADARTAEHILALDRLADSSWACGAAPINGLLYAARRHGLHAELIDLRNSGDTAGDRQRVVGYGAFAFRPEEVAHAAYAH